MRDRMMRCRCGHRDSRFARWLRQREIENSRRRWSHARHHLRLFEVKSHLSPKRRVSRASLVLDGCDQYKNTTLVKCSSTTPRSPAKFCDSKSTVFFFFHFYKRLPKPTILVHASLDALGETTRSALVPMCLVDHAAALGLRLADVLSVPADRSLEETGAAVAGEYAVVLSRRMIPAYLARNVVQNST